MVTDFPIQEILDHLVKRIVDILPITGAGVTLIDPLTAPRYVAASDSSAMQFERLQTELGEGPCLVAYRSSRPVVVPDLNVDGRFARFAPRAPEMGLKAVFTFPLRQGDRRLGALDLYRDLAGELTAEELATCGCRECHPWTLTRTFANRTSETKLGHGPVVYLPCLHRNPPAAALQPTRQQ
jgi:GAF domain-containing protein